MVAGAAQAQPPIFEDVTAEAGISGGSMVAWADCDGDGRVDLATGGKLFRNLGGGRFEALDGFAAGEGVFGDFDNDGRLDFYCVAGKGQLLRNLGEGRFQQAPIPPNEHQHSRAAAWGDADSDGHLDLYVTNYEIWPARAFPDLLYISRGDGAFSDPQRYPAEGSWRARGVNWSDFDNDGDQDFYVSNYRLMPNQLWVNDGRGRFSEQAKQRGVRGSDDEGLIPASADTPP